MLNNIYAFSNFNFNMVLICGLALFNIIYKVKLSSDGIYIESSLWNPTSLLFGPLLYWSIRTNYGHKNKNIGWHLLPFFIFLILYATVSNNIAGSPNIAELYYLSSWIIPASLFTYLISLLRSKKEFKSTEGVRPELLILIYVSLFIIAIIATMVYLCEMLSIDMGINYIFFTHTLLLIIAIFILCYFYWSTKITMRTASEAPNYVNSPLNVEKANDYVQQIQQYFEGSNAYLRSDLSLNVLAEELNIPKHYFSQLFNVHIGKSFYQYVAEYRVSYAIDQMQEADFRLKIESLAYECGFNSKSSFNKYFKSIVGCTPIEYLKQKNREAIDQVS